jgi:hypothetical protein
MLPHHKFQFTAALSDILIMCKIHCKFAMFIDCNALMTRAYILSYTLLCFDWWKYETDWAMKESWARDYKYQVTEEALKVLGYFKFFILFYFYKIFKFF